MLGFGELIVIAFVVFGAWAVGRIREASLSESRMARVALRQLRRRGSVEELDEPTIQKILQDLESLLPLRANPFKLLRYSLASPNAMAIPDGTIVLTEGLLELWRDQTLGVDAIAGVLAHEIAHVELGHSKQHVLRKQWVDDVTGTAVALARSPLKKLGAQVTSELALKKSSRMAEQEADDFAVNLLRRSPFKPRGLRVYLETLAERIPVTPAWSDLLSTHPNIHERIERLKTRE